MVLCSGISLYLHMCQPLAVCKLPLSVERSGHFVRFANHAWVSNRCHIHARHVVQATIVDGKVKNEQQMGAIFSMSAHDAMRNSIALS